MQLLMLIEQVEHCELHAVQVQETLSGTVVLEEQLLRHWLEERYLLEMQVRQAVELIHVRHGVTHGRH